MKTSFVVFLIIFCLMSCRKETIETTHEVIKIEPYRYISNDSCSYTINGKRFICDAVSSEGIANRGANFHLLTNTYDADSIQYSVFFGLSRYSYQEADIKQDGAITINFVKKYKKSDLISVLGFFRPKTDTALYQVGFYGFATDFDRFNNENGVAFDVTNRKADASLERLYSYIPTYNNLPTTINSQCQNNSTFEIIKSYILPNGYRIVEAKFTANVFNRNEELKRLENGFIRFSIF